jgi:hypothetical protein
LVFATTHYPFLNVAFLFSFALTLGLTGACVLYGKRRPVGKPLDWGEAVVAATVVFFIMFLAYGVVPHQWLLHAGNELSWRSDKIVYGPWNILKPSTKGGPLPFTISFQTIQDIVVVLIYAFFLTLHVGLWTWWQRRGRVKPAQAELPASSYGRPLVKKA